MNNKNLLLGILVILVFAVGFMVGRFSSVGDTYLSGPAATPSTPTTQTNPTTKSSDESTSNVVAEGGTTIQASSLSEGQKKLLNALGIDTESITVTPEMVACAETSLGTSRMGEITNGATPSFTEGAKLVACYK